MSLSQCSCVAIVYRQTPAVASPNYRSFSRTRLGRRIRTRYRPREHAYCCFEQYSQEFTSETSDQPRSSCRRCFGVCEKVRSTTFYCSSPAYGRSKLFRLSCRFKYGLGTRHWRHPKSNRRLAYFVSSSTPYSSHYSRTQRSFTFVELCSNPPSTKRSRFRHSSRC